MAKIVSICIGMLLLIGSAGAETYRCTDDLGTIIFTDRPAAEASSCVEIELPEVNTAPSLSTSLSSPSGAEALDQQTRAASEAREQRAAATDFALYKSQAEALVEEFKAAEKGVFSSNLVRDRVDARRKLGETRQRKSQLLDQMVSAGLSLAEEEEINNILAAITAEE